MIPGLWSHGDIPGVFPASSTDLGFQTPQEASHQNEQADQTQDQPWKAGSNC